MAGVDGTCDAGFAAVRSAFASNFAGGGEVGAACTVIVDGRVVVDLWGGWADGARTRPWRRDTLVNAYSVGKPLVALSLLQLVASGRVDLDATADRYWPSLLAGQAGATVRHVLSHQAGVPALRSPLTNDDLWSWPTMASAVAATVPWWEPGRRHVYHTNTYGFLVGELARRSGGAGPGEWLRTGVAEPLGADVVWGVRRSDLARCADVLWDGPAPPALDWGEVRRLERESPDAAMVQLGYVNPPGFSSMGVVNSRAWREAEVPSTNLHATATGVARVYAELARGGGRLLDRSVLAEAVRPQVSGPCPVLGRDVSFGLGFQPTRPDRPIGRGPACFGHFGTGGSLGFADPDRGLAFGYVMNAVVPRWQNPRNRALVDAVYASLSG